MLVMESILRGAATYLFVWLIFRMAGKRTLAQITTFDAVLLLIISETTQAALVDNDNSFTNSILLILTLLGLDVVFSVLKQHFPSVEKVMDGTPILIYDTSGLKHEKLDRERVDKADILHAARDLQGLENLDQVAYAVLETTGDITIVPKRA
jgi:uncharacterized membrane protein YcaP (DUF421 family)